MAVGARARTRTHSSAKPKDPWDKLLKNCEGDDDKVRRINQLGNVMYLPKTINIIVGNRPWNQKKMFYMALADNSGKAVDNLRARQQQLQLSMDDIDNLEEKKKLINNYGRSEWPKGYDSLAQWKEYTIDNRTAAIAEILWPHLCAWLGVDANQLGATAQTQSQPNPQAAPASANGTGTTPNKKQRGKPLRKISPRPLKWLISLPKKGHRSTDGSCRKARKLHPRPGANGW